MTLRLGAFGCRGDSRGLARQTATFAKHLKPCRIWGIDMFADNLSPYENEWSEFVEDGADLTITPSSGITEDAVRSWMRGLDVVLAAETFYKDEVILMAREEGVRTVVQYNPEFAAWHINPNEIRPDLLVNPTTWRLDLIPDAVHLPCPIDRAAFPFRLRTSADRFVHVAGHKAAADRAGTKLVIGAMQRLRSTADIVIRTQSPLHVQRAIGADRVLHFNLPDPRDLYADADVVLLPRRYGGQSLAMNEALSSGCPVITLNRDPENTWRGTFPIQSRQRGPMRCKGGPIPIYDAHPGNLVVAIQEFQRHPDMVERMSRLADEHAQSISWEALLGPWMDLLTSVADGRHPNLLRGESAPLR